MNPDTFNAAQHAAGAAVPVVEYGTYAPAYVAPRPVYLAPRPVYVAPRFYSAPVYGYGW